MTLSESFALLAKKLSHDANFWLMNAKGPTTKEECPSQEEAIKAANQIVLTLLDPLVKQVPSEHDIFAGRTFESFSQALDNGGKLKDSQREDLLFVEVCVLHLLLRWHGGLDIYKDDYNIGHVRSMKDFEEN